MVISPLIIIMVCMYIFNPSGECVGHVSSDVIKSPAGVIVDEDGFVCVCSFYACNVVTFFCVCVLTTLMLP